MLPPEKITLLVGDFSLPSRYLLKTLRDINTETDTMFVVCITGVYRGWNVLSPWSAETRKANMVTLLTQEVGVELDRIDVHNIYSYNEQDIIDEVTCALYDTVDNLSAQSGERISIDTLDVSMVPYGTSGCLGLSRLRSPLWTDEHTFRSSEGETMTMDTVKYALNSVDSGKVHYPDKPLSEEFLHDLSDVAQQTLIRYISSPDIDEIIRRYHAYMHYLNEGYIKKVYYHIQMGGYVLLQKASPVWAEDQWTLPSITRRIEAALGHGAPSIVNQFLSGTEVGVQMIIASRGQFTPALPSTTREPCKLSKVSIKGNFNADGTFRLLPVKEPDYYQWFTMGEVKRLALSGLLFSNCGVIIPCK